MLGLSLRTLLRICTQCPQYPNMGILYLAHLSLANFPARWHWWNQWVLGALTEWMWVAVCMCDTQ